MLKSKHSQIWVDTVVYTLIGLSIIALLLVFLKPTIESTRDKIITEQTMESMSQIDEKIGSVKRAQGNKRLINTKITKGDLFIDGVNDKISWVFDSRYKYSEPGILIDIPGSMQILTTSVMNETWKINITIDYSSQAIDLKYGGQDVEKIITPAATSYQLFIENIGTDSLSKKILIDISQE